jgi:aryl-alcohol dehydrogenase-like predicted oxidoreductase
MGLSQAYGPADDDESIALIRAAVDLGVTFLDTADSYGLGHNERLVGRAIQGRRDEIVLATKCGIHRDENGERSIHGSPRYIKQACEASLARLGVEYIDLFYQHRIDPTVPIEDTVGAHADLLAAGKIRYIGLSEASSSTLERAVAVHPITALQGEWSLWSREIEDDVVATARSLGIGIVAYAPLGRGFLTGTITNRESLPKGDSRNSIARFSEENFEVNLARLQEFRRLAEEKGLAPAQLALAWVLAQGSDVVAIPGTRRQENLKENLGAVALQLSRDDLRRLDELLPKKAWQGSEVLSWQHDERLGNSAPKL